MNWKSIKQPDIEIYLWSSGAQDGGGLIGVTLHPGPFSIHQERCMDRLKVKTRSESWERTGSRHQHQIISKLDEKHYVTLASERVFSRTKIKSQSLASNHLGSFWLDLNTGGERRRERGEGRERVEMRVTQLWVFKHRWWLKMKKRRSRCRGWNGLLMLCFSARPPRPIPVLESLAPSRTPVFLNLTLSRLDATNILHLSRFSSPCMNIYHLSSLHPHYHSFCPLFFHPLFCIMSKRLISAKLWLMSSLLVYCHS